MHSACEMQVPVKLYRTLTPMPLIITLTSIAIILSKFLDVLSTLQNKDRSTLERNPIVNRLARWITFDYILWIVFIIVIIIVVIYHSIVVNLSSPWQLGYIIIGITITIIHCAVAHQNYTGKHNIIVGLIQALLGWFYRR